MDLEDIKSLIGVVQHMGLVELEAQKNGVTLRLVREAIPVAAAPERPGAFVEAGPDREVPAVSARADLIAPLSGVLHLRPSPDAPPFVAVGQAVKRGETLCIIEAMKVFNRVSSERDGVVEAVLFESGAEVEAGQTLMRIA